jgi:hypothetical protein
MLPIVFSILIAILVNPCSELPCKKGSSSYAFHCYHINSDLVLLVITAISIITSQATLLIEAWPNLESKFRELLNEVIQMAFGNFQSKSSKIKFTY